MTVLTTPNALPSTNLRSLYASGQFALSIEIFPPKTAEGDAALRQALQEFSTYNPAFVSCTYGAGGSTRSRTLDWCREIIDRVGVAPTAHFTCVGSNSDELIDWLGQAWQLGVRNIMALRGDVPQGETEFKAVEGGFSHARQLVELIRKEFPEMGIGVAGYPEKHPEAASLEADIGFLKEKITAGGHAVFTQLFYDNETFYRYWEMCLKQGIDAPIIPGVMPITEYSRVKRIVEISGTKVPAELLEQLEAAHLRDDKAAQLEIGIEYSVQQCQDLIDHGVPGLHFYVLNKAHATSQILQSLGLKNSEITTG